jgi:hypothetical protein
VIRGGAWNNNARNCRSANRNWNTPDNRNSNIGFRLALPAAHAVPWSWRRPDPDEILSAVCPWVRRGEEVEPNRGW